MECVELSEVVLVLVVAVFGLGVSASTALAQKKGAPPAPPVAPDPAQVHIDQGAALYNDGNYGAALAEFEEAYKLKPAAYILNNIGLAQKALFRYEDAIATLERFLTESPNLSADVRAQTQQIIDEMKALLAPVTLQVSPPSATVTIDGRALPVAAVAKPLSIAAGSHAIEVTAEGYEPLKREILVAAGTPLSVGLTLKAITKTGKVRVFVSVPEAAILLDHKVVGKEKAEIELVAGGHTLEVSATGYVRHTEEVVLAAGQSRDIYVTLNPSVRARHWYQKWYIVAPIAVVVVGTATGLAIEFGTHEGPLEGSLGLGKAR